MKGKMFHTKGWIPSLLSVLLFSPLLIGIQGCETNPATGENEFTLLSTEQQRQLGAEADAQIVAQYGLYDNPTLQAMVERIGNEVQQQSNDTRFTYVFRVLDTEIINAFALPGGYIYVTRGLLEYLQNEAQLAMILGHEVGHVAANHSAKQYTSQTLASIGLAVGGAVFEDLGPFLGAAQTGLQLLFLKYSRDDETQADTLGVMYSTRAGYQASEGAEFFVTLKRMQEESGTAIPTWTSTHPDPADREVNIIQKAAEWDSYVSTQLGGTNPEIYLPRLDNAVFGQNPRHGFVSNGVFYHPDLQLQFPVPSGWLVGNFASQVQMVPENNEAAILFTLSDQSSPDAAATAFQNSEGVQTVEKTSGTVNGFPAVRLRSNVQIEGGVLGVLSYFIEKDQNVYLFHGYTIQAAFNNYLNTFESVFTNFNQVTNASVLNIQPFRVDVFQAPQTAPFSSLVTPNPNAGMDIPALAIFNQKETSESVPQGAYLKEVD